MVPNTWNLRLAYRYVFGDKELQQWIWRKIACTFFLMNRKNWDLKIGPIHGRVSRGGIGLLTFTLEIVYKIEKGSTMDPIF
jgi:hypothetical protein